MERKISPEVIAARAAARLARQVEKALVLVDLSVSQYRVLAILDDESPAAGLLADRLAVRPASVTSLIDGLVARGLVERRADPDDRRRQSLSLTPNGATALAAADDVVADRLHTLVTNRLDARRATRAMTALGDWNEALDRAREEAVAVDAGVKR